MTRRAINTPQSSDSGSHGYLGFEYQVALAVRASILMLAERGDQSVTCEFHDDMVRLSDESELSLVQVKQSTAKTWTLAALCKAVKKNECSIFGKLFMPIQQYKDVKSIALWGYGRVEKYKDGSLTLERLIYLLETPDDARDKDWEDEIVKYVEYICTELQSQGIVRETIYKGIDRLSIKLDFPSPDAIELANKELLGKTLHQTMKASLALTQIEEIHRIIVERISSISKKPNQHWKMKTVSRPEIIELIQEQLRQFSISGSTAELLTTQDKLSRVGLGDRSPYAFERRIDARWLEYELEISAPLWEDIRTMIALQIGEFRKANPDSRGIQLWDSLLEIFEIIGNEYFDKIGLLDRTKGRPFIEGVFFDMTGVCLAEWMKT